MELVYALLQRHAAVALRPPLTDAEALLAAGVAVVIAGWLLWWACR